MEGARGPSFVPSRGRDTTMDESGLDLPVVTDGQRKSRSRGENGVTFTQREGTTGQGQRKR